MGRGDFLQMATLALIAWALTLLLSHSDALSKLQTDVSTFEHYQVEHNTAVDRRMDNVESNASSAAINTAILKQRFDDEANHGRP
jgi:hypothetical protein